MDLIDWGFFDEIKKSFYSFGLVSNAGSTNARPPSEANLEHKVVKAPAKQLGLWFEEL
ncbi:hypothetical protein HRG84_19130 [Flavisolibacter sp. BT320]|nr:hypothetical protein [Flavisolibacter longurius]